MRILLVFIVVLNLLYAGWQYINPAIVNNDISPLPDNLKSLELLYDVEAQDNEGEPDKNVKIVENTSPTQVTEHDEIAEIENTASCYTLGPFKDKNIMQQVRESIAEFVTDISVRKRQESEKHRYWVYVPASASRKQAKLIAKKLRQKNLNDFYIVLSGEAKNSISLGHFREPKHASRRVKTVVDLGFKAEINIIYRDYEIYWLDYQVNGEKQEASYLVDEYASDGISQIVRDCKI